jgi:hypothetical protein
MNAYEWLIKASAELELARIQCWRKTLTDAEANGEELYYDMSNPKLVGLSEGPTLIGQWKRRKKASAPPPTPAAPTAPNKPQPE